MHTRVKPMEYTIDAFKLRLLDLEIFRILV